jgi:hypothetical protein
MIETLQHMNQENIDMSPEKDRRDVNKNMPKSALRTIKNNSSSKLIESCSSDF